MEKEKTTQDIADKIRILAQKTKADPNPDQLEELKKAIKKNVPFTLRRYFCAYLLRELLSKETRPQNRNRKEGNNNKPQQQAPQKRRKGNRNNRKNLPEDARTLYLNIGKMKRLYPKELSQVFQDKLNITSDDVYSIRIHDKYSFVSLSEKNCEKAIEVMNGIDIKGRTISVSYSNKER